MRERLTNYGTKRPGNETMLEVSSLQLDWPLDVLFKPQAHHFVVVVRRWWAERSFGWLSWCRGLSVYPEKTVASAEAMLRMGFIAILLNRIT